MLAVAQNVTLQLKILPQVTQPFKVAELARSAIAELLVTFACEFC